MIKGRGDIGKGEGILKVDLREVSSSDWKYFSGGNDAGVPIENPNGTEDSLLEKAGMSIRFF